MKRVHERSAVLSSLVVGSLVAVLGCSASTESASVGSGASAGSAASAPEQQTPSAAPAGTRIAAVAPSAKSKRVRILAEALSGVPLRDDQRVEIEGLASDADAQHQAAARARGEILTALAGQVEAGQIDRAALQPKIDAATQALAAARPADEAALQRLHALLTPEQRGQVADALESRHKEMRAEHTHAHGEHRARMDRWAADLKLTDAQRAQIMAAFASQRNARGADFKAMHEKMAHAHEHPFAESFRADTLTLPAPTDAHVQAGPIADHFIVLAQTILPILTPEQRTLAAAKLRERVARGEANEDAPLTE